MFSSFWLFHVACGILFPRSGIEPGPLAVKALNPNHWTPQGIPEGKHFLIINKYIPWSLPFHKCMVFYFSAWIYI